MIIMWRTRRPSAGACAHRNRSPRRHVAAAHGRPRRHHEHHDEISLSLTCSDAELSRVFISVQLRLIVSTVPHFPTVIKPSLYLSSGGRWKKPTLYLSCLPRLYEHEMARESLSSRESIGF